MIDLQRTVTAAEGFLELGLPLDAWETLDDADDPAKQWDADLMRIRVAAFQALDRVTCGEMFLDALWRRGHVDPDWWRPWIQCFLFDHADVAAAEVLYEAAEIYPLLPAVLHRLARCKLRDGNDWEADRWMEHALRLDPTLNPPMRDGSCPHHSSG